nr:PREDICTED: uncharacterized protein LOC105679421 isoform X2 [Linepithema humile]
MEKKVYCLIEGRCKCIKFMPEENTSEIEIIRRKLKEASKTDNVLNMMLQQKMIILQKPDPDRDNKLCDLEDNDEVADKNNESIVKILYTEPIDDGNSSSNLVDIQQSACYSDIKEENEKEK